MQKIQFSREERKAIVSEIQTYFHEELEGPIGDLPAEMLLNFFAEQIGGYFYNRGLGDAQAALAKTVDEFSEVIYALEQPTKYGR
jgi:uncharacterized protein (DUF2164 family)